MNYLITGGSGFIGRNLIRSLLVDGHKITVLTRNKAKTIKILGDQVHLVSTLSEIKTEENIDYIINLAGEPIADKKWSAKQKEILIDSRVRSTKEIINFLTILKEKPKLLISASAIGYYGLTTNSQGEEFDEDSATKNQDGQDGFTYKLCKSWENQALEAKKLGIKTYIIRLGVVLGKDGGIIAKMLPIFKIGLGGKMGDGKQFMSWIHIKDVVSAIQFIIKNKPNSEIFNLTSPNPVSNLEFTKCLAKQLRRPTFFNIPAFAIKIIFGKMGENLLIGSQKVKPKQLLKTGFKYKFSSLDHAIKEIIGQQT